MQKPSTGRRSRSSGRGIERFGGGDGPRVVVIVVRRSGGGAVGGGSAVSVEVRYAGVGGATRQAGDN